MSPLARRRLFVALGALVVVLALGVRKYVKHRERIPLMSLDAATLAAARSVHVTVYSAEWCHSCRDAEAFLHENGIPFEAHDVDSDAVAAARMAALNPRGTIPVIDIEGNILVGYEPRVIEATLAKAALKRSGGGGGPHS